jgi:hypothetical protein
MGRKAAIHVASSESAFRIPRVVVLAPPASCTQDAGTSAIPPRLGYLPFPIFQIAEHFKFFVRQSPSLGGDFFAAPILQ